MMGLRRALAAMFLIGAGLLGLIALTIMPNADATALKERINAIPKR
jgi:Tfp pilus assembly protein PilV